MKLELQNALVYRDGQIEESSFSCSLAAMEPALEAGRIARSKIGVFPGFCDVHVHLREPGFFYKETIATGTLAAARGGYTDICAMPNLNPVPDSVAHLREQLALIEADAVIGVHPYGAITVGEAGRALADLEGLAPFVAGFSDDGRGVQSTALMEEAMRRAKALCKIIVAHCEEERELRGGVIHDGAYARAHGHRGISSKSEWAAVERDLALVEKTGCAYHVCHVSTKESVALIRQAKAKGLNVTSETAPHYLLLEEGMLEEDGRFKMNPPIRGKADRQALIEGLQDGTIDMIATDHAPHAEEEKAGGLDKSLMGVTGLECAFPVLYTHLVKTGLLPLEKLIAAMADKPRRRFGLPLAESFSVWDLDACGAVEPRTFLSKGKSTPFAGWPVAAECLLTMSGGKIVWQK